MSRRAECRLEAEKTRVSWLMIYRGGIVKFGQLKGRAGVESTVDERRVVERRRTRLGGCDLKWQAGTTGCGKKV